MGEVMTFRGKYAFLSNMYAVDFEWDGRMYHNSEAAFQSAKSLDPEVRNTFCSMTGVVAKRQGKRVKLRGDWESVKLDIMEEIVRAKFSQNPELKQKLIDTGDMELVEGNSWHDTFWGVDALTGRGENNLGVILMKIRAELGGAEYEAVMKQIRADRAAGAQQRRYEIQAQIAALQAEIDALPVYNFVGMSFRTKAFGTVTILRREGDYLFFEVGGKEKKFALPGCIAQGFLVPEDPNAIEVFCKRDELRSRIAALQKQLKSIR